MVEEMEIREIKDMALIPVDKEEIQRPARTVMLQYLVSLPAGRNILRSRPTLRRKLTSRRRLLILAVLSATVKKMVLLLILRHS